MKHCKQCDKETNNPKFCNRSCAASYNNRISPKRKPEHTCLDCTALCNSKRARCQICYTKWLNRGENESITLKELKGLGNANFGGRYSYIRQRSRKKYINSGKPMICHQCKYDYHVDIAHIKDIRDFPETATLAEINAMSNLVPLCRNHHWEFDKNHLIL